MKQILTGVLLMCLFAACTKFQQAPPPGNITGIYAGEDSVLLNYENNYSSILFGQCIEVKMAEDSSYSIKGILIRKISYDEYQFQFKDTIDFGIGNESDIHIIEHKGKCKFGNNRILIHYTVGETNSIPSEYKFIGWK